LAGWLALLKIDNEAQPRTTGHRQILLGDLQLFTPCANSGANLLWNLNSIHVTDREYTVLWSACQAKYYRAVIFYRTQVFLGQILPSANIGDSGGCLEERREREALRPIIYIKGNFA